jgi:hypothetical protein
MLDCEKNTPEMEHEVINAFPHAEHRAIDAAFEHGQWWISCCDCGGQWSVCDSSRGFDYEQVTEGDESC